MTNLTSNIALAIHPRSQPERLYRWFFTAAILVMLTAGATWGAWLLWRIAGTGSLTDISIHMVNAHGHAQIFGWVGLFIMGFAYQAFPRVWGTRLAAPHLAIAAMLLMLIGLALGTTGQALTEAWALALPAVVAGGIMQIIAVAMFAGQIALTFRRGDEPLGPAVGFIFMALFWFLAMTVMSLWHTTMLMTAETREALLHQIATWQAPLRDIQILGLALYMILGVSMRFFPGMFGLPRTPARHGWLVLGVLTFAVTAQVSLAVTSRLTESSALSGLMAVPWIMLALGVGLLVLPWRLWRPFREAHRSNKFVRAAFLWLGVSLAMLLLLPGYMVLREMEFSHAYYGAMRHAMTVGFVSMMIVGVASKVVPVLRGVDHQALSALWGPFVLINAGCALRVSMQALTDWHPVGFNLIAFSGAMEVAGFAWWGIGIGWLMLAGQRSAAAIVPPTAHGRPPEAPALHPELTMGQIAERYPALQAGMARLGLESCCSAERTLREIASQRGLHPALLARLIEQESRSAATSDS